MLLIAITMVKFTGIDIFQDPSQHHGLETRKYIVLNQLN